VTEQPIDPTDGTTLEASAPREGTMPVAAKRSRPAGASGGEPAEAPEAPPEPADPADSSLLNLIDRLSALLDRTELSELEVQVGSTGLVLRKTSAIVPAMSMPVQAPSGGAAGSDGAPATQGSAADAGPPARPAVMAPLTGIWYGAPSPGTAPYVNLGGEVAVGQVIGLIEAMKLFNEIKSDRAGRVTKINAEDGKLVRAKQPLIEVDPL
jgi:acetyl-CoA carboxylase biotin carboxyl carrier protein